MLLLPLGFLPVRVGAVSPSFLFGVFLMVVSLSGASSFSRAAVVVSSVRWCPSSSSVFVVSACGASFVCRVFGGDRPAGRVLWVALVAARDSGSPVVLGFRGRWSGPTARCSFGSGAFWFDGLAPSSEPVAPAATAWGLPVPV